MKGGKAREGQRGWGRKGAATKAADSSRIACTRHGETTSGPLVRIFSQWSGYSLRLFVSHQTGPNSL